MEIGGRELNVKIDYEKLAAEVKARGKTNGLLSVQIAKDRGYIIKLQKIRI